MGTNSIKAYENHDRVQVYDNDMDIMHPLRWKMIDIIMEIIPYKKSDVLNVLDIGIGTGAFEQVFLEKFFNSRVTGVDGSDQMIDIARSRLGSLSANVKWIISDFTAIPDSTLIPGSYDLVVSSYSLHHLDADEKLKVLKSTIKSLKPGGWFFNADLIVAKSSQVEKRIQEIRVDGVTKRGSSDSRFTSERITRNFLNDLEAEEQDKPLNLEEDLQLLKSAGIISPEVFWKEYCEAVIGGIKE